MKTGLLMLPGWRKGLLAAGECVLLLAAVRYETVLSGLYFWSGEANIEHNPKILVNGQQVEYNGTVHRLLIWKVYLRVMRRAGFLGFGTDRTTGFPVRVPFGPEDKQTLEFLRFVDNAYILMDLRFGILGVLCLVAVLLSADFYFLRAAQDSIHECQLLLCRHEFGDFCGDARAADSLAASRLRRHYCYGRLASAAASALHRLSRPVLVHRAVPRIVNPRKKGNHVRPVGPRGIGNRRFHEELAAPAPCDWRKPALM